MKIIYAILGYILGVLMVILILAMIASGTNSAMPNPFIFANIAGVILAIVGYNYQKKK